MANESLLNLGAELILETAAAATALTTAVPYECTSDDRQPSDNVGYSLGLFEFDTAAGGFSGAPTAGAKIHLYEQKINSDAADAPDVASTYLHDLIGSFIVKPVDELQHLSILAPIHRYGGKYWLEWVDGDGNTATVVLGWELRLTPATYGT